MDNELDAKSMRLTAAVTKEGKWHIARCLEVEVTTQGETIEEALHNLKEALELYFEDAPPREPSAPPSSHRSKSRSVSESIVANCVWTRSANFTHSGWFLPGESERQSREAQSRGWPHCDCSDAQGIGPWHPPFILRQADLSADEFRKLIDR